MEREIECSNCGKMQLIFDIGICVECGNECCKDCSEYGIGLGGQKGWLCSKQCIEQEATDNWKNEKLKSGQLKDMEGG